MKGCACIRLSGEIKPTKKKRRRGGRKINKDREMDREKDSLEELSQTVVGVNKSHSLQAGEPGKQVMQISSTSKTWESGGCSLSHSVCRCKNQELQSPGQEKKDAPNQEENLSFLCFFCSIPVIIGLVDASTLLRTDLVSKPRIQMLIPVRNTLTDTPRIYVLPTI